MRPGLAALRAGGDLEAGGGPAAGPSGRPFWFGCGPKAETQRAPVFRLFVWGGGADLVGVPQIGLYLGGGPQ